MRVLTFTTIFPSRSDPTRGVFVRERMRHVAGLCDVEVVAPVPRAIAFPGFPRAVRLARVPREEEIAGLPVHHPRYWSLPGGWPRFKAGSMARGARATVERLHREAPFDLIDAHFAHPDGAAAAQLANALGIPFVLSLRGSDIHRDLQRPALRPLILSTASRAERLIAVAQPLADRLEEAGIDGGKIDVIPNGVDAERFAPRDRVQARAAIGASFDEPLVLAVGALRPVKGFDVLVEAVAAMGGAARLWIVGEGPERGAIEDLVAARGIAGRVRLVGAVAHEQLPDYYAAADAFVLSSRNEGCPNVLLEALASGCPAVGTRVGHVPQLLRENRLVAPADVEGLARALDHVLAASHDRMEIRAVVAGLTWERVAARVLDVFTKARRGPGNVSERTSACSAEF